MGGHDHGHHHGPPYTIPDYRIYKVEDAPLLLRTQNALAAKGLKDPWLRNEVWRYDEKNWGSYSDRIKITFKRGFKIGFTAFVLTVVGTKIYDLTVGGGHDDHGEHH
ncbi:NADH dehydrogenase [ubiquinone] 1 beta subcomplex subunit 3 [Coccinella septempunctata]|uniref:NADH dehydrogenase [ubiquinone] 1 beta subcomplex subunit 3 n=1 Tax=Coccinella septempunctata TaxID=41139 RepID=UPI001D084B36|nr:NADH dehydrogenase [ubiquinone] 1 beta subcomplex subunit 3 [Coccinella septempunctata]